ncbi:hypothetical protein Sipo8835_37740 [Streptomyces ipomoeae]|jgi:hypothetical protein|uniref:Uncharacterized protein n=1 Tax=Streptomyces ipomoeae TaxID=103232 RepID=A0A540QPK1_9ACTN|nr:hypothetical protein [Streptomyces ipomoeae]MDX2694889.1 hypothetical protein [Streptomyces ipomoeae]MDX2820830.1 hypothetical protein [Streptomyces ipomoeae]MDX2839332.1 hypothetical protein [Streptomyces ipomoeae]MDX2873269.1 hypothetical protein [Streptomyces ipomoeae]MDX2935867.1 hypothetical protein [Streptomyces ipomoeae]
MKSLKAAAVVAGSLVVAGFATPALALDLGGSKVTDISGTLDGIADGVKVQPLEGQKLLDPKSLLGKDAQKPASGPGTGQTVG